VTSEPDRAAAAAQLLWAAWCSGQRVDALPAGIRPRDAAEGMAAQAALREHGGAAYGWKIAATATAGQAHIGVDGPLPGPLFDRFRHEPGDRLPSADLHMRVVEAEFAFVLAKDVAPGDDMLTAVDALHLAVEVPDSRFTRFERAGEAQLRADAACASRFVLGPAVPGWRELDLAAAGTALWINGAHVASGTGANVLGDPRTALTWLVTDLDRFGLALRAGDVVTTGTTTVPGTIGPGDTVRAAFGALGSVALSLAR
jgi:2-keto-4-pentenoate hydratase